MIFCLPMMFCGILIYKKSSQILGFALLIAFIALFASSGYFQLKNGKIDLY